MHTHTHTNTHSLTHTCTYTRTHTHTRTHTQSINAEIDIASEAEQTLERERKTYREKKTLLDEKKEKAIYAAQIRVQTSVQAAVVAEELSRKHIESVQQLSQKVTYVLSICFKLCSVSRVTFIIRCPPSLPPSSFPIFPPSLSL